MLVGLVALSDADEPLTLSTDEGKEIPEGSALPEDPTEVGCPGIGGVTPAVDRTRIRIPETPPTETVAGGEVIMSRVKVSVLKLSINGS